MTAVVVKVKAVAVLVLKAAASWACCLTGLGLSERKKTPPPPPPPPKLKHPSLTLLVFCFSHLIIALDGDRIYCFLACARICRVFRIISERVKPGVVRLAQG